MHDDAVLTTFERQVADDLERYTRGVVDVRPTSVVAYEAVRGRARPRPGRWWSRPIGRLILVAALVASVAIGIVGVGGSRPSIVIAPSPSPSSSPAASAIVPYPLAGSPGLVVYQIANIDDSASAIHLVGLDGSSDSVVATDVVDPRHEQPEWTAGGSAFTFVASATSEDGRDIWRYDLDSGTSALLLRCVEPCADQESVAMSPDQGQLVFFYAEGPIDDVVVGGQTIAIPRTCSLRIVRLTGDADPVDLHPTACGLVEFRYPRWAPASDRIAAVRGHQDVRGGPVVSTELVVIDLTTSADTVIATRAGDAISGLDWSPDGQWIVFTDGSSLARIHPDGTGLETLVGPGPDAASHPRHLAGGSRITFVRTTLAKADGATAAEGTVVDVSPWIVDAAGGEPVKFLPYGTFTNWMGVQPHR